MVGFGGRTAKAVVQSSLVYPKLKYTAIVTLGGRCSQPVYETDYISPCFHPFRRANRLAIWPTIDTHQMIRNEYNMR